MSFYPADWPLATNFAFTKVVEHVIMFSIRAIVGAMPGFSDHVPYNFHVASMGKAEFLSSKPVKYDHQTSICHQNLVGGLNPSEKYEFVSWDYEIPNIWKVIKIMFQTTNQKSSLKKSVFRESSQTPSQKKDRPCVKSKILGWIPARNLHWSWNLQWCSYELVNEQFDPGSHQGWKMSFY